MIDVAYRHDGLEFLWTPNMVCHWSFEDPDADHRNDFDGPPILERSVRRMRSRHFRSGGDAQVDDDELAQHDEPENEIGIVDATPTEYTSEHLKLRCVHLLSTLILTPLAGKNLSSNSISGI